MLAAAVFLIVLSVQSFDCRAEVPTVVLIKVGGSSITRKAIKETLNPDALAWFVRALKDTTNNISYIIVHGAGSFGHHTAKEYGLRGQTEPPGSSSSDILDEEAQRKLMLGLGRTRLSVQMLNQAIVSAFLEQDLPAVGISPCFGVPGMQAHGGDETAKQFLRDAVESSVASGLIPILHGDAGLYGERGAGIMSGDTVMEILGQAPWISNAVFLTDVDGVFTADPNTDDTAVLLRTLLVDTVTAEITSTEGFAATSSTHDHDVTGGLKVSRECAREKDSCRVPKTTLIPTVCFVAIRKKRPNSLQRHPSPRPARM